LAMTVRQTAPPNAAPKLMLPGPASPFTQKVRLVLKLNQIPYSRHPFFHITVIMRNLLSSFCRCPKHDASSRFERQFSFDVPKDSCPRNWSRGIEIISLYLLANAHRFSPGLLRYFIDNRSSGAPLLQRPSFDISSRR
jgi:hypothetical protein